MLSSAFKRRLCSVSPSRGKATRRERGTSPTNGHATDMYCIRISMCPCTCRSHLRMRTHAFSVDTKTHADFLPFLRRPEESFHTSQVCFLDPSVSLTKSGFAPLLTPLTIRFEVFLFASFASLSCQEPSSSSFSSPSFLCHFLPFETKFSWAIVSNFWHSFLLSALFLSSSPVLGLSLAVLGRRKERGNRLQMKEPEMETLAEL